MKKVTKNQIILLFAALCGLVIAVFAMYFAIPMLTKIGEVEEDYINAENKLNTMKTEGSLVNIYLEESGQLNKELIEALDKYDEIKSNATIDAYLINILEKNGCQAIGLGIDAPIPIEESAYFKSDEAPVPDFDEGDSEEGESENAYANSGIYVISANYSVNSSYQNLLKGIAALNAEKSVKVGNLAFTQTVEKTTAGTQTETYSPSGGMSVNKDQEATTIKVELGEELECSVSVLMFVHPAIEEITPPPAETDVDSPEDGTIEDNGEEI